MAEAFHGLGPRGSVRNTHALRCRPSSASRINTTAGGGGGVNAAAAGGGSMSPGQQYTLHLDGFTRGRPGAVTTVAGGADRRAPPRDAPKMWSVHDHWWLYEDVLHAVFAYVGMHQVHCGRTATDEEDMFSERKTPRIQPTALVNRHWHASSRQMKHWDFSAIRYTLSDRGLSKALKVARGVQSLSLVHCRKVYFMLPMFGLVGRNITTLNLCGCANLTDAALSVMTAEMPKLTELYIAACHKIETLAIAKPYYNTSHLQTLDISGNAKVADDAVERVFRDHPNIRDFFASQCEQIIAPRVASTALELVNLDGCENLTFASAMAFFGQCPNLKYVTLGENEKMLEEPGKRFINLTHVVELNISSSYQDDDMVNSALTNLPALRLLDVSNSDFMVTPRLRHRTLETLCLNQCCELSETCFDAIERYMPALRHLSANNCYKLTRPQIRHRWLQVLDLSSCPQLFTDTTLSPWLDCPHLQRLYLGFNGGLADPEIELIAPGLSQLQVLNIYQCGGVVRPDILTLVQLKVINIMNCWNVEDKWVDEINKHLPNLQAIYVNAPEESWSDDEYEGGDPNGW